MSKSKDDVRSWLESQSAKLRIPDINMLIDMYLTNPDDDEIASLTTGILGESPTIRTFLNELINQRLMSGISSRAAARDASFPSIATNTTSPAKPDTAKQPKTKPTKPSTTSSSSSTSSASSSSGKPVVKGITALSVPTYQYGEEEATKPLETAETIEAEKLRKQQEQFPDLPSATATPLPEADPSGMQSPTVDEQLSQAVFSRIKVKKTKQRKINLPGGGASSVLSPDIRELCGCQCREHGLVGNCTTCGRIVCEQEGEGPCFFCGSFVASMGKGDNVVNTDFTQAMQEATVYAGGYFLNKKAVYDKVLAEEDPYANDVVVPDANWGNTNVKGSRARKNQKTSSNSVTSAVKAENPENQSKNGGNLRPNALSTAITSSSVYALKENTSDSGKDGKSEDSKAASRQTMGLLAATSFRDNLLRRAREQGTKPKIFDEQNDYYDFEGNAWLNTNERVEKERMAQLAEEAVEDMRKTYTLDIDISKGTVGLSSGLRESDLIGVGAVGNAVAEVQAKVSSQLQRETQQKQEKEEEAKVRGTVVQADVNKVYNVFERGGYAKAGLSGQGQATQGQGASGTGNIPNSGVSNVFRNDTLSGRAKQVYDSMRKLIKENVDPEKSTTGKFKNSGRPQLSGRVQRGDFVEESVGVDAYDTIVDNEADASFLPGAQICDPWGNSGLSSRKLDVSGNMAFSGSGVWGNAGMNNPTYFDLSTWEGPDLDMELQALSKTSTTSTSSSSSSSSSSTAPAWPAPSTSFAAALSKGLPESISGTGASNSTPAAPASRWATGSANLGYQSLSDLALTKADEEDTTPMSEGAKTLTSSLLGGYISANYINKGFGDSGDVGMCLSMHQPWASLLLYGLKRFEGRGWNSNFRGRLWIASTARKPDVDEITAVEDECRRVYGAKNKLEWPKTYPHGVLLGCVDMVGCWTHEEFLKYREDKVNQGYLVEENESQHVFVCTNPRLLGTPITITGQHKLWTLPANLHKGLPEQLRFVNDNLALFVKQEEKEKDEKRRFAEGLESKDKEKVILPKKKK